MLRMKRGRLIVEVAGSPGADEGRPSDGHQDGCLLTEVEQLSRSAMKSRLP